MGKIYHKLGIYQPSIMAAGFLIPRVEGRQNVKFCISHQWLQLWRSLLFTFSSIHHCIHCFWKEIERRIPVWALSIYNIVVSCPYPITVLTFVCIFFFECCCLLMKIKSLRIIAAWIFLQLIWNVESNSIFKTEVTHI